jgi:ABC-2 type transport system ATP-binding protein
VESVARRLGLVLPLETRFRDLSGGQKQKLLLALALAKPTKVIVLDEPTASLDAEARDAFFALFNERSAGSTLVLSSHRDDDMRALVRRTVALDSGRIAHAA